MSKKPTVLMILDGFGLNEKTEGNAIAQARTPVIDGLMKDYPFVKGNASGLAVGLPDGQMGNSEVGHLNMGAGRIDHILSVRTAGDTQYFKLSGICGRLGDLCGDDVLSLCRAEGGCRNASRLKPVCPFKPLCLDRYRHPL